MDIKPLPKQIHDKAIALGIDAIYLSFSGGNDEGYLNVHFGQKYDESFAAEVENWAWEAYHYNGAGDGTDYGDDITYDLKNKKVNSSEWFMKPHRNDFTATDLEVAE